MYACAVDASSFISTPDVIVVVLLFSKDTKAMWCDGREKAYKWKNVDSCDGEGGRGEGV